MDELRQQREAGIITEESIKELARSRQEKHEAKVLAELGELSELTEKMQLAQEPATTENEVQTLSVKTQMSALLQDLLRDQISPRILQLIFLWNWLEFFCHLRKQHNRYALGEVEGKLAKRIKSVVAALKDDGPTPEMKRVAELLENARKEVGSIEAPTEKSEVERQNEIALRRLHALIATFLEREINPYIIRNMCLYFWARLSTMNEGVPEAFFQTIERNWPLIVSSFDTIEF